MNIFHIMDVFDTLADSPDDILSLFFFKSTSSFEFGE